MAQTARIGKTATKIYRDGDVTRVQYHNTDAVKFDQERIELFTNGWNTKTTKLRMNQASQQLNLGYYVYQKDGEWHVITPRGNDLVFDRWITFRRGE